MFSWSWQMCHAMAMKWKVAPCSIIKDPPLLIVSLIQDICYSVGLEDIWYRMSVWTHEVCWGNKWMGSSDLNTLNKDKQVEQLARASKQNDKTKTTNKWQSKANEVKDARCLGFWFEQMQMLWAKMMINLKLKLGSDQSIQILVNW